MNASFDTQSRTHIKDEALRQHLLESVNQEKTQLTEMAEAYYEQAPHNDETYLNYCKKIIAMIDNILAAGNWEDSLFLRNTVKPLKQIREQAIALQQQILGQHDTATHEHKKPGPNKKFVYISLYQSDGHNLKQWELQLKSIAQHMVARPAYQHEADVQKSIHQKIEQASEAYAVVVVDNSALNASRFQPPRHDRNGHLLLTLPSGSVSVENIIEFVHQGQHYHFVKGQLAQKGR